MIFSGDIIIAAGILFILSGVIGIIKFKNFYTRLLVAAKIDTVGVITIIVGISVKHGLSFFSLKALLLMAIMMIINPLASHMIARSAYMSGYRPESRGGASRIGGSVTDNFIGDGGGENGFSSIEGDDSDRDIINENANKKIGNGAGEYAEDHV
jgi:multicomponent Na+:H+ antiporter subunit G